MILHDRYDGGGSPFQGERELSVRGIPVDARIERATVTVTPVDPTSGASPFTETIGFHGALGDWGATKSAVASRWVEVDFHARRTLVGVRGRGSVLDGTHLQVDMGGGAYVAINKTGSIMAGPDDEPFSLDDDVAPLPALTVAKFMLTSDTKSPDVTAVRIRSAPTNLTARLGTSAPFWTVLGESTTPVTSPDFALVLQSFLAGAAVEHGYYVVPLVLHSDTIARLEVALEVEYALATRALPAGVADVTLGFDLETAAKPDADVLAIPVPANARATADGTSVRVKGSFDETRIVAGPKIPVPPDGVLEVSRAVAYAQPLVVGQAVSVTGVDLFVAVARDATLQLDVRGDLGGKPDSVSILPKPVRQEVRGVVGAASGRPAWVSVRLPAEVRFEAQRTYWLVLQSVDGSAAWQTAPELDDATLVRLVASAVRLQRTDDGGFSWRDVSGGSGTPHAAFRLRRRPNAFTVPITLQIGDDRHAVRVSLDRFAALGRVDFALDPETVADAVNHALAEIPAHPAGDHAHVANGDLEQWFRIGDDLSLPMRLDLDALSPSAIAITPDGTQLYVAGATTDGPVMRIFDAACNRPRRDAQDVQLTALPTALVAAPDGTRVYAVGETNAGKIGGAHTLQVVDTIRGRTSGTFSSPDTITAMALSPDGGRLYLATSPPLVNDDTTPRVGAPSPPRIHAIDIVNLERVLSVGDVTSFATIDATPPLPLPTASTVVAVSSDGRRVYVIVSQTGSELMTLDAATLQDLGTPVTVGVSPQAIAVAADGRRLTVANTGGRDISVIELSSGIPASPAAVSVDVGGTPVALAVPGPGTYAYVAIAQPNEIAVIDLARHRRVGGQSLQINVGANRLDPVPIRLVCGTHGDRSYVLARPTPSERALLCLQAGERQPLEWNLQGSVVPICLRDPFHAAAALGVDASGVRPLTGSALSQVVPVVESSGYDVELWAIATDSGAAAALSWRGADGTLLRTDTLVIESEPASRPVLSDYATAAGAIEPELVLHRQRLSPPVGATAVELRITSPADVLTAIDDVSLLAASEALVNGDFLLREDDGRPVEWTVSPAEMPIVMVSPGGGPVRILNAGADAAELVQTVPVALGGLAGPSDASPVTDVSSARRTFEFELRGGVVTQAPSGTAPSVELQWVAADGTSTAPAVTAQVPSTFTAVAATGTVPSDAVRGEVRLIVPGRTTVAIERVSLRFADSRALRVTFLAEAPGELAVTDFQVGFTDSPAASTLGADAETPPLPSHQPDEPSDDEGHCPCCRTARTMTDRTAMRTASGRLAIVGRCNRCSSEMVQFASVAARSAPAFALRRRLGAPRRRVRTVAIGAPRAQIASIAAAPITGIEALRKIPGIGAARARLLLDAGIHSVAELAASDAKRVATVLKGAGVSAKSVALMLAKAKEIATAGGNPLHRTA